MKIVKVIFGILSLFGYSGLILAGGLEQYLMNNDQFKNLIGDYTQDIIDSEEGSKCEKYLKSKNITISESGFIANVAPSQKIRSVNGLIIDMNNNAGFVQAFRVDKNTNKTTTSQGAIFKYSKNTVWYVKKEQLRFKDSALRIIGKYSGNKEGKFINVYNREESIKVPIIEAICIERGRSNEILQLFYP